MEIERKILQGYVENRTEEALMINNQTRRTCRFLEWDGERFSCSIYERRPEICRRTLCKDHYLGLANPTLILGRQKWGLNPLKIDDGSNLCRYCAECCSVTPPSLKVRWSPVKDYWRPK